MADDNKKGEAKRILRIRGIKQNTTYKELEQIITDASTRMIALPASQIDRAIHETLEDIGSFTKVDRCYIFMFSPDGATMSNTHEWCAPGIEPQARNPQNIPSDAMPWWTQHLKRFETIHFSQVCKLPPEAAAEQKLLKLQGIQSVAVVPLVHAQSLLGFAGFDSVRSERIWQDEEIHLLRITGDIIANALIRKQFEESLKNEEQEHRILLENLPVGVIVHAADTRILFANNAASEILGLSQDEMQNKTAIDPAWGFVHEDGSALTLEEFPVNVVLRSGKPIVNHVIGIYRPDLKQVVWGLCNGYPVHSANSQRAITEVVITFADITTRKQAELALRESEETYHALLDGLPDIITRFDKKGRHLFVSENIRQIINLPVDQIIGRTHRELGFPEKHCRFWEDAIQAVFNRGGLFETEFEFESSGQAVTHNWRLIPEKDELGLVRSVLSISRDITEGREMETKLLESEERFSAIFKESPMPAALTTSRDFAIIDANQAWYDATGYTPEEVEGIEAHKLGIIDENTQQEMQKEYSKSGVIRNFEIPIKIKNGEIRQVLNSFIPVTIGTTLYGVNLFIDITERKKAERLLQESKEHYRIVSERMSDFAFSCQKRDKDYIIDWMAGAVKKVTGYSVEDILEKGCWRFMVHPEDDKIFVKNILSLPPGKKSKCELRIFDSLGELRWLELDTVCLGEKESKNRRVYGGCVDITARKKAEQRIKMYKTISDHALHGTAISDLDGNLIYVNDYFAKAHGYSSHELVGKNLSILHNEEQYPKAQNLTQQILTNGQFPLTELWHTRKDGSTFPMLMNGILINDEDNRPCYMATTAIDISERKRSENILHARARLASQSFSLGLQQFMQKVLDEAESLTESNIGFFHLVEKDGNSILLQAWSTNTLAKMCTMEGANLHYPTEQAGMWADAIRDGLPHIYNDYQNHPLTRGLPDGHATITRFITMPILDDGKVVAIMGVGNNPHDYNEKDIDTFEQLLLNVTDIFLRKRAEDSLKNNEERLRLANEAANQGLYDLNLKTGESTINEEYARMLGYEPGELQETNQKWLERMHPDDLERVAATFTDYITGKTPEYRVEFRQRAKDGNWKWILSIGKIFEYDILGHAGRMLGIHANITEQKIAEQALRESEAHNRAIITALPDVLFQINPKNEYIDCRTTNPELLLIPPEEFLGRTIEETLPPELAKLTVEKVQATLRSGEMQIYQYELPINNVREYFEARMTLSGPDTVLALIRNITRQKMAEEALTQTAQELENAYEATLQGWSNALELREHETAGHSLRVVEMTLKLARKMGIPEEELEHIQRGALLHDIGKMGVPDSILLKPGPLSEDEWVIMRQHPQYANKMIAKIPYLKPAIDIPYCHHEKWDGTGYPRGLKGEQIPLAARIFTIIDTWDALSHDRPYRPGWPKEDVLEYLKKQSKKQFSPQVVKNFIELLEEEPCEPPLQQ